MTLAIGPMTRRRLSRELAKSQQNFILSGQFVAANSLFVSSTAGNNTTGDGTFEKPFATISAAHAACVVLAAANTIDDYAIILMPGHAETVNAAAYLTLSCANVRYIGLGTGTNRPILTWSTSIAAQIIISGANVSFSNIIFSFTGIDAITAAISVTAIDVSFDGCTFNTNSGTTGCVLGILTAATATRFRVENCRFVGPATNSGTTTTAQIQHEVGIDYVIRNNYFTGKMTQAILNATTILGGLIDNNRFVVATGTKAIAMAAASTPFISNNRINVPSGTAPIVAAAGFMSGNNYSAAAGVTAGTASTF